MRETGRATALGAYEQEALHSNGLHGEILGVVAPLKEDCGLVMLGKIDHDSISNSTHESLFVFLFRLHSIRQRNCFRSNDRRRRIVTDQYS